MKLGKLFLLVPIIGCNILITNSGCTEEKPLLPNISPIANAGPDQTIMKPKDNTLLSGERSHDTDGKIVTFKWTTLAAPNSPQMDNTFMTGLVHYEKLVYNLEEGEYLFELMVIDDDRATSRDTIKVTVIPDSPTRDPARMKRFNTLWWDELCEIHINNISSAMPAAGSFQVFMVSYSGGGPMPTGVSQCSGWYQIQPVRSSAFWYEVKNDILIIHPAANIDCALNDAIYDVLIRWN